MRGLNPNPTSDVATTLERFVRAEGRVTDDDPGFDRDVDLFTAGYLDSLGTVHLIAFIEEHFAVDLHDDVLADPTFTSLNGIAALIEGLRTEVRR
ncbi:phosphopantetheine-binding protein [Streptomyces sp. NPDC057052]|uniref:phosphopantetheine-binding protein n=1 Tax=Streptomyces sp. NPDC057052 TaxID=3346010 RepID=UPI0036351DE7